MKRAFPLLLILSSAIMLITLLPRFPADGAQPVTLPNLLQATGASFKEYDINSWTYLDDRYLTLEELQEVVVSTANRINPGTELRAGIEQEPYFRQYRAVFEDGGGTWYLVGQSLRDQEGKARSYLVVDRKGTLISQVHSESAIIEELFSGREPAVTLIGYREGSVRPEEIKEKAFAMAKARLVEGVSDQHFVSLSAYSPYLGRPLVVGGRYVNLNIGLRYDPSRDRTLVAIGSPLITVDY